MEFMEQIIIATKQEIIEGTGINPDSKNISKCVQHKDLEVMEIPKIGFVTYRYYVFSGFKL